MVIMKSSTKNYLFSLLREQFDETFITKTAILNVDSAIELLGKDDHRIIEMISDFEFDFGSVHEF